MHRINHMTSLIQTVWNWQVRVYLLTHQWCKGFHVAQAGLKFDVELRMTLSFRSSLFPLPGARILCGEHSMEFMTGLKSLRELYPDLYTPMCEARTENGHTPQCSDSGKIEGESAKESSAVRLETRRALHGRSVGRKHVFSFWKSTGTPSVQYCWEAVPRPAERFHLE